MIMVWNWNEQNKDNNGKQGWYNFSQMNVNVPPNISRIAKWLIIPLVLLVLFLIFNIIKSIWTEWLWFSSLDFGSVYSTIITAKIVTFFVAFLVFILLFIGNLVLAWKLAPRSAIPFVPDELLRRIRKLTITGIAAVAIIIGLIFGSTAQGNWETILK